MRLLPALPVLLLLVLFVFGCSSPDSPVSDGLQGLTVTVPATAVAEEPFPVTIEATGEGADGVEENLALSVSAGTVTPTSVRLSGGLASLDVTITGAAGEVTVTADAGGVGGSGTIRSLTVRRVPGGADEPVAANTPRIRYVPRAEDYSGNHPEAPGMSVSHNTMLLLPATGATVGDINAFLEEIDGLVVGGAPGAVGVAAGPLVVRVPGNDHAAFDALLSRVREDARIAAAAQDVEVSPTLVPGPASDMPPPLIWSWRSTVGDGNWGMELSRAPQMWNLNAALRKRGSSVPTGVVDFGFAGSHPDLGLILHGTLVEHSHGAHVAGTIGARFDNGRGVDGMNPFAELHALSPAYDDAFDNYHSTYFLDGYIEMLKSVPGVRVVNMSLAYNWSHGDVDTDASAWARTVATHHGRAFDAAVRVQALAGDAPILLAAAGNDSEAGLQQARWASPMCNAALEHGNPRIIVVEAVALNTGAPGRAERAGFSNVNAHISAPGADIVSASTPDPYESMSGTSMAAPHVAGLVGYLLALDSTLTADDVRLLLSRNAVAVAGGASPRIDAFASAVDIDQVRGDDAVLRMLCDIDDGTLDGNTRVNPFTLAVVGGEDVDGDGGSGDGSIDMSDFRRWRDWQLQAGDLPAALDGDLSNPKFDVNGDGFVSLPIDENVFPRGDFNGDGVLSRTLTAFVPGAIGAPVTDLAVLQRVFQDPDYAADDLPGLADSADLHVDATELFDDPRVDTVELQLEGGGAAPVQRTLTRARAYVIHTLPPTGSSYAVRLVARGSDGVALGEQYHETGSLQPGQDLAMPLLSERIALDVTFPVYVEAGTPAPLAVRAGMIDADGDTTYGAAMEILLVAEGGDVEPAYGFTDASGFFASDAVAAAGQANLSVTVIATTPGGMRRTEVVQAAVDGPGAIVIDWVGTHIDYDYGDCVSCVPSSVRARTVQQGTSLTFLYDLSGGGWCPEYSTALFALHTTVAEDWISFSGDGFRVVTPCDVWVGNLPAEASLSGNTLSGSFYYQDNCPGGCWYEFTLTRE